MRNLFSAYPGDSYVFKISIKITLTSIKTTLMSSDIAITSCVHCVGGIS